MPTSYLQHRISISNIGKYKYIIPSDKVYNNTFSEIDHHSKIINKNRTKTSEWDGSKYKYIKFIIIFLLIISTLNVTKIFISQNDMNRCKFQNNILDYDFLSQIEKCYSKYQQLNNNKINHYINGNRT